MDFQREIKDAIAIVKLDEDVMLSVAKRKHASWFGVVLFVIPMVLNLIFFSMGFPSGFGAIFQSFLLWSMVVPVVALLGTIFLISEVARRMYKGKGDTPGFFGVVSYVGIVYWLSLIPSLLSGLGILSIGGLHNLVWLTTLILVFAVSFKMLVRHHRLKQEEVVVVLLIGGAGYFIFQYLLGRVLVGRSYRFFF